MGKRGPRRHRGIRVSLGKLAAGRASRLCQPLEKRAGASRSLCDKRIRALEHGRQRARMVRRLVRRQLLQLLSQSAHHSCTLRSEEHTSELQSRLHLVCRLLLEKKKKK